MQYKNLNRQQYNERTIKLSTLSSFLIVLRLSFLLLAHCRSSCSPQDLRTFAASRIIRPHRQPTRHTSSCFLQHTTQGPSLFLPHFIVVHYELLPIASAILYNITFISKLSQLLLQWLLWESTTLESHHNAPS